MKLSWSDCTGRVCRLAAACLLLFSHPTSAWGEDELAPAGSANLSRVDSPEADAVLQPLDQPLPLPVAPWSGDWRTRSQATGDWLGARSTLAANGVTVFGDLTQYYQGVTSGGLSQQFKYGWRGDYLIDLDSQKLGLWDGGHLDLRGESRMGQDTNQIDGTVALSNFGMALPLLEQNVTALTGVQYTQDITESTSVFFGKLNLLDGTPGTYAKGTRLNYFSNAAMQSNLCRSYLFPSILGCGMVMRNENQPVFSLYLLDTNYRPTTNGFPELFSNGMVIYSEYRLQTNWFDKPGYSAVGFLYSTATRSAIDTDPYYLLDVVLSGGPIPTTSNAWTATYRFDQLLYVDQNDPSRKVSLNSDVGITDGNPNPIQWFGNISLLGNNPTGTREHDSWGVGYYHLAISNVPLLSIHGLRAEDGAELFYNVAVTPWFHLTPSLQVLDPAQQHNANATLVGIRGRLSF